MLAYVTSGWLRTRCHRGPGQRRRNLLTYSQISEIAPVPRTLRPILRPDKRSGGRDHLRALVDAGTVRRIIKISQSHNLLMHLGDRAGRFKFLVARPVWQ
jgi:hypothetical protein